VTVTLLDPPAGPTFANDESETSHFAGVGLAGVLVSLDVQLRPTSGMNAAISAHARRQRDVLNSTFSIVSECDTILHGFDAQAL
jgi:hypothetical protein